MALFLRSFFFSFFLLSPSLSHAETIGARIRCDTSLTFESQKLADQRYAKCIGGPIRKCSENGLYTATGPTIESVMTSSNSGWEYYSARSSFNADGSAQDFYEGDFQVILDYAIHTGEYDAAQPLFAQIALHQVQSSGPRFSFDNGTSGIALKLGEVVRMHISQLPQSGLRVNKIHGDDELRNVLMICNRMW